MYDDAARAAVAELRKGHQAVNIQLVITGDPATGSVQVQGPLQDMRLVHWLLGEARRVCEGLADRREAASNGKPPLVLAAGQLPPLPR